MSGRRGITLLEIMISLVISSVIVVAITSAYAEAIAYDKQGTRLQEATESRIEFEQRLRTLLRGAYVSPTTTDSMTYFLGDESGNSITATAADTLIFTTLSEGVNGSTLGTQDDFETLNQTFGPQGGIAEVALSMTAVGDAGQTKTGLFLREQRPADGDPTQGGTESLLSSDVKSIQFEFYDGANWDPTWSTSGVTAQSTTSMNIDTSGTAGRRIPAAVRVTYVLTSDLEGAAPHVFVVRLPQSDVTAENPVVTNTATGGTP